ncbi:MAG TPA: glycogen/starch synthase, partial [Gemmatimonadaceae bacterium]
YPYARTGGLAEAVAGLATFQARDGNRVVVFMPLYALVREAAPDLEPLGPAQTLAIGPRMEEVRFFQARHANDGGPEVIFVDAPAYFKRAGLYGELGADYPDNDRRFALFARAALEGILQFVPGPVLIHAHDWHTALAAVYTRTYAALQERFASDPIVVSVHNAGYQGHFPESAMDDLGLPWELWTLDYLEWYGKLNVLKGGLKFCDMAVTVSPTHARELCTPEGGFGLHHTFQALGDRLVGITNGIDQRVWDPAKDDQIAAHYSCADVSGKAACKAVLQRSLGLPERTDTPLFGMTGRLVKQKGFDIVLASERVRRFDAQFVFLGEGEPGYRSALAALAAERRDAVAVEFAFTDILEHRLMAGSDVVLMPSLYEPCGLTQLRAQRYGAPVVGRRVGGIHDTVQDDLTGFLFDDFTPEALDGAIDRALARAADERAWHAMMRRAMESDFGWERAAKSYGQVYAQAAARR